MTMIRLGAFAACAALACAGPAASQTGGRPAPRVVVTPTPAPSTPSTNPTLALPMKMPVLASDPAVMLAQINLLRSEVAELQKQVAGLKEWNTNQESRMDSIDTRAKEAQARFDNHQHVLNAIGFKTVPSVTCKPTPGGYPSCSPDQFPALSMVIQTSSDADKKKALTTTKPIAP